MLRHSPSSATTRRALIAFAALLSLVPASQAVADSTEIISGIGVFLDDASAPGTPSVDKVGSVAPGEFIAVHIVTDIAAASPFPGASGAQFRVEIDPRFQIITKTDGDDVALSFETAPNEWDVAFTECNAGTAHLLSYYLQLPAGETDLEDLRVDVTAPAGGRMAISTCGSSARLNRAFSAGGVVLNPSTPSIVHLSRSADVLVDGRDLKLAWETSNATGVTLDGNSVAANGTAIVQPSVDTTYLLEATNGGTATKQFDVEVIRKPRVDLFTVELLPPGNAQVRVSWDIQGVEVLSLDGVGFGLGPFGDRVLPLVDPPNYEISATNEWGTTQALATLDDLNELPPSILSFAIQPANAPYGTDATMTWSVFNADQVSISPDIGVVDPDQGLLFIPVESDQSYTITATNGNGSDVDMATLTVATPVIEEFFSSNETPIPGSSIDLVWDVVGAQTLEIQPDVGFVDLPSGSVTVTPQSASTTYVLIANSPGGMVQRAVDINWSPPFVALSTSTPVVFGGTEVDIEVTIFGADTATLTPEPGALIPPVSQTIPVVVDETTLFTLTAENVAGTRTVAFLVSAQQPEAELEASQTLVPAGTTVTLTATIDGAQSAVISPDLGVIDPAGGSFDVVVDTSTLFQLHATNPTGTTTVGVEVLVEGEVPVIHSFEADPASIVELQSSTLSWDVSGATQIEILPGGYTTTDLQGSLEVTPSTDTTYRLIASSPFLTVESTVTVEVEENDLGVVYFEADPQLIAEGETANLLWFVLDADEVAIEPGGFTSTAGLGVLEVSPTETTEYTLTASKGPVSIQATTTITVAPFRVISFEVSPLVFLPGESVTVSWEVVGTADVSVDGFGPQPLVGSFEDTPTGETTYTLRVQNGAAIAVRQETVIPGTEQFPGGIVMSFTPDGSQWQGELPFGVPTTVYAVLVGSYWDGVLGVDYGLDAHPSIVVLSEELLIPGSTDDGLGAQEMVLELPECVLTVEPVAIVSYDVILMGTIDSDETILGFRTSSSVPPPAGVDGPRSTDCWGELTEIETVIDLSWEPGTIAVLSIDLELGERPEGRLVRWDMNGEPDQLTVYRGESMVSMEPIHTMPGSAAGEWTDTSAQLERPDYYRIEALVSGERVSSEIVQAKPSTPSVAGRTRLLANVPNPFNPSTEIRFVLEKPGSADVDIYDVSGRRVFHRPFHGLTAGEHFFVWGGLDRSGRSVSSGVYLVRLNADGKVDSRSITLVE